MVGSISSASSPFAHARSFRGRRGLLDWCSGIYSNILVVDEDQPWEERQIGGLRDVELQCVVTIRAPHKLLTLLNLFTLSAYSG